MAQSGGGFFATFGLTIAGAKGGTPIAFLLGGLIAPIDRVLLPSANAALPRTWRNRVVDRTRLWAGLLAATMNVLLILSYIAIMGVYAAALASYFGTLSAVRQPSGRCARHCIARDNHV